MKTEYTGIRRLLHEMHGQRHLLHRRAADDVLPEHWCWGEMPVPDVEAHALLSGCFEDYIDLLVSSYENRMEHIGLKIAYRQDMTGYMRNLCRERMRRIPTAVIHPFDDREEGDSRDVD